MPLPEDFSPVEHFQDTVKRLYNKEVREHFSDLDPDQLGIDTPRASLRTACTHQDPDSLPATVGRMLLFDLVVSRKLAGHGAGGEKSPPYSVNRRQKPQVLLWFVEDLDDVEPGYRQVEGRISFRIMDEAVETFSQANATALAQRVKTAFGAAGGFVWQKGKAQATYSDWEKGYQLQLYVKDKAEGKRVVEQVLDVQQHSPDWEFFNYSENEAPSQAFPSLPPTQSILGKSRRLARRRPRADVRFQYAVLNLAGLPNPIALYDRSGTYPDPLVL
jgi:hypothetical protein